jgi:D-inositol-3-phosphate glycosyltransferase
VNPPPLSIAFVVVHTSPLDEPGTKDAGGMNVVVRAHAEELAKLGAEVQLITRRSDEAQPDEVELAPGLTAFHLAAGPARLLAKGEHEALVEQFADALRTHLAEHPVQLLHAEHWYSGLAALPIAGELGIPLVQSYHSIAAAEDTELSHGERPEARGRLAGERAIAQQAELIVTVSEAEKQTVVERLGGDPDRVRVVEPGVDTRVFRPAPAAPGHETGHELLVAGRLDPLKRFDLAIEAVAAIAEDERPTLRIVGSAPPDGVDYEAGLRAAAEKLGDRVVFEPALGREALAERLREAALVLIPSHSETYGLVALEAAASGTPVVASATGGLRESVLDGRTGVLIETARPEVWAAVIRRILGDEELYATMSAAARTHAMRHSWLSSARRLRAAYRELLADR